MSSTADLLPPFIPIHTASTFDALYVWCNQMRFDPVVERYGQYKSITPIIPMEAVRTCLGYYMYNKN